MARPEHAEAFVRQWVSAQQAVASFVAALVPNPVEAEDILQNVAAAALRKFAQYDGARPFRAWAIGVARLEVLGARRAHARSFILHDSDLLARLEAAATEEVPARDDRREALRRCLEALPMTSRELLRLRYEGGLAPAEIAGRMGKASGAVRVWLSRLRSALADCIERRLAEGEAAR